MSHFFEKYRHSHVVRMVVMAVVIVSAVFLVGWLFIARGERILEHEVQQRLQTVAILGSMQFHAPGVPPLDRWNDDQLIGILQNLRDATPDVRFAYVLKRTDNPLTLEVLMDADAYKPRSMLDIDNSGFVEPDESPLMPGAMVRLEEDSILLEEYLNGPVVKAENQVDAWRQFVSVYAPISDDAILALEVDVARYNLLRQGMYSPIILLLLVFAALSMALLVVHTVGRGRMDALRQLNAERSALIDMTSHQLGAPLASMSWWMEILCERLGEKPSAALKEAVSELQDSVTRMTNMLQSLSSASSLSKDMGMSDLETVCISEVLKSTVPELEREAEKRNQKMYAKMPAQKCIVRIDPDLARGMIQELVRNAMYYSPDGSSIHVTLSNLNNYACIEVVDHGYGVPERDQSRIFERFVRGSNAAKHRPVGNGLGLYIVRKVVEQAGGKVQLHSTEGKGTTVRITLPLVRS